MMAYSFSSSTPQTAFEYLRIEFKDGKGTNTPAIFCKDFFAEEIQAEASGESNLTFYTRTYASFSQATDWVCPNQNKTNMTTNVYKNMKVFVVSCEYATQDGHDPDFLPDLTCASAVDSKTYAERSILHKSFTNSNFVPAQYSSEKTLQQYATVLKIYLSSISARRVTTNI